MASRDAMKITPRLTGGGGNEKPRQRAKVERELTRAKRKRGRVLKRLRQAHLARRVASRKKRTASRAAGGVTGNKLLGRAGWVGAIIALGNSAGRLDRMAEAGISRRLLDAMDADRIWGGRDERITAIARTRQRIEGDDDLLRIINSQGRVNNQISKLSDWFLKREQAIATGADLIEREVEFDSFDTNADKFVNAAREGVKRLAIEAAKAVRDFRGGSSGSNSAR